MNKEQQLESELNRLQIHNNLLKRDYSLLLTKYNTNLKSLNVLLQGFQMLIETKVLHKPANFVDAVNYIAENSTLRADVAKYKTEAKVNEIKAQIAVAQRDFILDELVRFKEPKMLKKEFDKQTLDLKTAYNTSLESELKTLCKKVFENIKT